MRRPRVRFSVRRLMIAVAIFGSVIGVWLQAQRLRRLGRDYHLRAVTAAREERLWNQTLIRLSNATVEARSLAASLRPVDRDLAELWDAEAKSTFREEQAALSIAAHYAGLARKYRRAEARPWEAVAADPKEPKFPMVWRCFSLPKQALTPSKRWYARGVN
jgi:hypothetical protein